jgi:hypothetical protein
MPPPTVAAEGRYTKTYVTSGIPELDAVLMALEPANAERIGDMAALRPTACSPGGESGPPCGELLPGAPIPAFLDAASRDTGYLTGLASVRSAIERAIGSHAAWAIYAVSYPVAGDPITEGYVVGLRAATGNSGLLWYVTPEGSIVGVRDGFVYFNGDHPELTYICGPSYGPITCKG